MAELIPSNKKRKGLISLQQKEMGKGSRTWDPNLPVLDFGLKCFSCPVHPDHCEGHEHQWWSSQERQYSNLRRKNATTGPERAGRADRVLRFILPETITRLKLKPPENRSLEDDLFGFLLGRFGPMFRGYLYFLSKCICLKFSEWRMGTLVNPPQKSEEYPPGSWTRVV